jgi:hypothetical protein
MKSQPILKTTVTSREIIRDNIIELATLARKFKQDNNRELYIYTMSKCVALQWFEYKIEKNDIPDQDIHEHIDIELYIYNKVAETAGDADIAMITWTLGMIKVLEELKELL